MVGIVYYAGLCALGLVIGFLSGLFGVGGGFLLVPMLNAVFNVPYNIAIGSSLCQMIGTSFTACMKHRGYGHIDYKLAGFLLLGCIGGAELGARLLMRLKQLDAVVIHGHSVEGMYLWVNIIYIAMLLTVGTFMFIESKKAQKNNADAVVQTRLSQKIRSISFWPNISLAASGIGSISTWSVIILGFAIGVLSGLLGIGGGFVLTPALIYLLGVPTSIAIGTGLFQIMFVSAYGTFTHFLKGNVDFILVACILAGSLIGSQLGAILHKRLASAHIRYYFSLLIFLAIAIIVVKFLFNTGYLGSW